MLSYLWCSHSSLLIVVCLRVYCVYESLVVRVVFSLRDLSFFTLFLGHCWPF
ncbi:hypothetical protein HanIR_Chr04g0172231 [Helianthus annuus]|nr:hypothetical protein HanIR_Chr04g0172231 [Helianthus annuus]